MFIRFSVLSVSLLLSSAAFAEISINPYPLNAPSTGGALEVVSPPSGAQPSVEAVPSDGVGQGAVPVYGAGGYARTMKGGMVVPAIDVDVPPIVRPPVAPRQVEVEVGVPAPVNVSMPVHWRAMAGANVRDVLGFWSADAGVDLLWNAHDDYEVEETVDFEGGYEEAVATLLAQYKRVYVRPVGSLHVDAASGRKTLVVTAYEGS